jgi:hypothetical protein
MGDYLYGEQLSTTFKQVVAIGGTADRVGIHATTQKALWTDDGAGSKNLFPFTAATDAMQLTTTKRLEFNDDAVYIHSSTDGQLNLVADGELDLTAGSFDFNSSGAVAFNGTAINIDGTSASRYQVTGGNLTLTTVSSGEMFLTPVNYIQVASGKKLQFADSGEYLSGDGTNLTLGSGADIILSAANDINIPANVGLVFDSNDSEKIESNDTDLTISSGAKINLTATSDVVIPTNVGLQFTDANEKIESDGTNLTINSGADINLTCATGDVNIPADIGLTFGDDGEKIEGDGTDLSISSSGNLNLTSTVNEASAVYVRANGGTSETIKIHSAQGTSVTEGAPSLLLLSDAGGIGLRSTANLANAINLTVDGGSTSSMTLFNDQGTSVTEGAASIQLLTDAGGIGIKSAANLANAILLTADGGTDETIKIHSDQGTGNDSIELTSDAGGVDINVAAGKTFAVDAGIVSVDSTASSNLTMTANTGSTQTLTVSALNSDGSNIGDLVLNADGQVHIRSDITTNSYADAGIQIGTDLSGVDVAIGHTTSDVRIGDNLLVTGDGTVSGNLTVTGTLSYGAAALSSQAFSGTAPYLTFTNTTEENNNMDDSSDNATGRESKILFKGEKADGTAHELATIQVGHEGTSDDYKGQIQFFTNSGALSDGALALAMTIADSGYVGIGTAAPVTPLHVDDTSGATLELTRTANSTSGTLGEVQFGVSGGDITMANILCEADGANDSAKIAFGTQTTGGANTTRMTIKSDGKVGIGVTDPDATLEVKNSSDGAVSFKTGQDDTQFITHTHNATGNWSQIECTTASNFYISTAGNSELTLTGGKVGIGDVTPTNKLDVNGVIASWGANLLNEANAMKMSFEGSSAGQLAVWGTDNSTGGTLNLTTKSANASINNTGIVIIGSGNVGIGTASPSNELHVHSTSATSQIRVSTDLADNCGIIFHTDADNASADIHGHIGIDHSEDVLKMVYGETFDGSKNGMVIEASGNVGINELAPSYRLDVQEDRATNYVARFQNDGGDANRYGITLWAGKDEPDTDADCRWIAFHDGDGGLVSTVSYVHSGTTAGFNDSSDERLKRDIEDTIVDGLDNINALRLRKFYWKPDIGRHQDLTRIGLVAQEVESLNKDISCMVGILGDACGIEDSKSISWSTSIPYMIKAIQELSAKVEALENA